MNKITESIAQRQQEVLQDRFGLRVAAALTEQQQRQPRPDIDERLRFARSQALAHARERRQAARAPAAVAVGGSSAALLPDSGADETPWWLRLSSLLPLALLAAGLLLIDRHYTQAQIEAAVEVDVALLADDLPPEAYRDPGFVEFLKSTRP
jgi:Protein of unknown function (DUF3619)